MLTRFPQLVLNHKIRRPRWVLRNLVLLAGLLLLGGFAQAGQCGAQTVGEMCVAKVATDIHAGKKVVGRLQPGESVRIQSVNGEWAGVKHRTPGWVASQYLVSEKQAMEYFNARLAKDPSDLSAYLGRARCWKDKSDQQLGQSIGEWTESLRSDSQQGAAYLQRARLWRAKRVMDRAMADFESAIKLLPFDVTAYQELANLYMDRGEYRRAAAMYSEVMRLKPWQPQPHIDRAWAYFLAGFRPAAMFDLQMAQRLGPNNALVSYRMGLIRVQDKQLAQAKVDFDRAIELNPRLAEAYMARGPLHKGKEEEKDQFALHDYNIAIYLSPQYVEAYLARVKLRLKFGEYDRAIDELSQIVKLNPRHAQSYFDRGKLYLDRSEGDLALADFSSAAEIEPEFKQRESETYVLAYRRRAEKRLAEKQFELAVADYTAALEISPKDWELLAARGQAYLGLKDYSRSLADLTKVSEERGDDPASWFALAHTWYLAGQYGRAAVEYRKAILVEPTFVPAYTNLAWLLATCPDKEFRNGKLAVRYATYACELTGWKQYAILDTLAAAQAEAGDFHEAIKFQSAVVYMSPPGQREEFQSRLALYGGLKPYREVQAEETTLKPETDTAGVLANNDQNSAVSFAKSLEEALPDVEALAAENAAAAAAGEVPSEVPAETPLEPTEVAVTDDPDQVAAEKVASEPGAATKTPAPSAPLKKDDPAAVAALTKLGGRTSIRPTGEVQSIGLQYTKFTDRDVALLDGVPSLEILDLTFDAIGEPTLKKLGSMKQLKLIVLDQTKITDDMLAHLAELTNLEVLSVKATTISGKGLQHLQKLPKLNMVLINGTRVTSAQLKEMSETMPKVKFVR